MSGERHVADFVEEDISAVSGKKLALALCNCAGERSLFVSESSLSTRFSLIAAQLTAMKGRESPSLSCRERLPATISLPTPDSPVMRTDAGCPLSFRMSDFNLRMAGSGRRFHNVASVRRVSFRGADFALGALVSQLPGEDGISTRASRSSLPLMT